MAKRSDSVGRIRRIFEIHKFLRNKEGVSGIEIIEYLERKGIECNERIVASTIADIRLLGAEISANKHRGYWYSKPFTILEVMEGFDGGDMNEILAFVRQKANDELFNRNIAKLLITLEQEVRSPDLETNHFIQFEKVELKNIEKLDLFYKYITEKRVLDIDYRYYGSQEPVSLTILPILLREYNNRWVLIAYSQEKSEYQNYALDRIISEKYSSLSLSGESNFNATEYFKNVIGSSVDKRHSIEKIFFRVRKRRAFYVETKKWHPSQIKEDEDDQSMTFSIIIIPNKEFWAKVMEHIEDIEILDPKWIAHEIRERVKRVWDRFANAKVNN